MLALRYAAVAIALVCIYAGSAYAPASWQIVVLAIGTITILAAAFSARDPTPPRIERASTFAPFCGVAAMLLEIRPWIGGIPAYVHDWKWPLDSTQLNQMPHQLSSLWLAWGSGAPAIQALGNYPVTFAEWCLGLIAAPQWALLGFLLVLGAIGGVGAARACAAFSLDERYQLLSAFAYPLLPAAFNRLSSGHLTWMLGYVLFPLALAMAVEARKVLPAAGRLGALWGIAGSQIQFLLFLPVLAVPMLGKGLKRSVPLAAILAIALQAPMLAALAFGRATDAYASSHANLYWQQAQSSPFVQALLSAGDPARYFASQFSWSYLWLAPLLALAITGAWRNRLTRVLACVWIFGALWSSGLDGPLAAPFSALFTHVEQAIAFREFSHAEVLAAIPLLLLAAEGASSLAGSQAWGPAAFALCLVPLVAPAISGEISHRVTAVVPPPGLHAVVGEIAALPGKGQVLWWPGLQPLSNATPTEGVDPEALPAGEHNPYLQYRPTVALVQALQALQRGDVSACGLLADLGVQAVVLRSTVRLHAVPGLDAPPSERLARLAGLRRISTDGNFSLWSVPCYRGQVTVAPLAMLEGDWRDLRRLARTGATDERTLPPPAPKKCRVFRAPRPSYVDVDPKTGFVPLSQADAYLTRFDAAFSDVVITTNPEAPLPPYLLFAKPSDSFQWAPRAAARAALRRSAIAIWLSASCAKGIRVPPHRVPAAPAAQRALLQANGKFALRARTTTLIVLHQSAVGAWNLSGQGGNAVRRVQADGYAIGWVVGPGRWLFRLTYAGPRPPLLWAAVTAAFIACGGLILFGDRERIEYRAKTDTNGRPDQRAENA